ncbi:MAG: hypothetical protein ABL883_07615 [Terricaulis sp.]
MTEDERDALSPDDFKAAGVIAPDWNGEPVPSLETWRSWRLAEQQAMAHKRAHALTKAST